MANLHLVTGYAGREHVTAADHAVFHSCLFGGGQFVFDRGNKLAASIITNNLVRVQDGDIYMQGRHIRLNEGSYVDLNIENGTQGVLRNDLIVARYTKDGITAVEDVNLVVIKGDAVASSPADPVYTNGDLLQKNDPLNDMPLYRVVINGLNVQQLIPLFTVNPFMVDSLAGKQKQHGKKVVKLSSAAWGSGKTQTVNVDGVTENNTVIVSPAPDSSDAYSIASAKCTAQGNGTLTFSCKILPLSDISVNIVILGV